MKKNSLRETIEFVGLSFKKEIFKIIMVNLVFLLSVAAIYLFLHSLVFAIITLVGLVVANYFLFSRFKDKKRMLLKSRENE